MANVGSDDRLPHLDIKQTMGTTLSTSPQLPPPTWSLSDLQEELLSTVVGFLPPRDVEALTVASKTVAYDVLPRYPIWKHLFIYRWNMWNYALERDGPTESVLLEIDDRLKELAPSCSESRLYQLLAHAVTPVPSFADVRQTERGQYFSHHDHAIDAIGYPLRRRTLDIAYTGSQVGGDRCVRANTPFMPTFRVAVYAISNPHKRRLYRVGLVASGYFEITIRANPHQRSRGRMGRLEQIWRHMNSDNMTSIGLATSSFPLIDRQPGWDRESIGYHGDDGHFFHQNSRGRRFSTPFSVGDTVGCGLRRDLHSGRSFVYFTNNGDVIPHGEMGYECNHSSWYPIVGLDCHDIIHFNFGQEPFACAAAVDTLFDECNGQQDLLTSHLSWYNISESDAESSEDESLRSASASILGSDSDADSEMGYDRLSDISELAMYMNRVVEQEDQFGNEGMDEFGAEHDETS